MSEQKEKCKPCPEGRIRDKNGKCVMPDLTFSGFILSLNTSALYHMGELAHPETGEHVVDLELAKQTIDMLVLLQEKTRGNLDKDEDELMTKIVYELKMHFVKVAHGSS